MDSLTNLLFRKASGSHVDDSPRCIGYWKAFTLSNFFRIESVGM